MTTVKIVNDRKKKTSFEEVVEMMLFETEENARRILQRFYPNFSLRRTRGNTWMISDASGRLAASVRASAPKIKDLQHRSMR